MVFLHDYEKCIFKKVYIVICHHILVVNSIFISLKYLKRHHMFRYH